PDRLDAWSRGLGAGPNWTQVTGPRPAVVRLLKALHAYNADKNEHTPLVLAGDDRAGRWSRVHGLATPERLARVLEGLRGPGVVDRAPDPGARAAGGPPEAADPASPGLRHFTDTPVVDQHGTTLRMFSDLLRDRVVVVNFFFTSCKGSCPVLMTKLRQIERHFRGRGGSGLVLVSISVDPARDGVPELATRAGELGVGPGWHLVTAKPEDMKLILSRFGQELGAPEQHTNVLMVGNERTKLWKKLNGLSPVEQLIPLVEEVMDDRGDTTPDVPAR
ncbi:MAG: hypothetical protein QOE66_3448, partial [Chloroflexota bacterium]|nr:hypothetical protein [Chloroflexota bacterium]